MEREFLDLGIVIADRLTFFRHGLIAVLRDSRPDWRIAEAGSFPQLLDQLRGNNAALVLADFMLAGMAGCDGIRQLRYMFPDRIFVVLAEHDDRGVIWECLAAGAQGYILRAINATHFMRAIDTVLSGGVYAPATLTGAPTLTPMAWSETATAALPMQLTDRQREVFQLLAQGCPTKAIARQLNVAVGTVKVHLAAIYRVLGARTRLEALARARATPAQSGTLLLPRSILDRLN